MTIVVEEITTTDEVSYRQRLSNYFVLIFGAFAFFVGINLRDSALNATTSYKNPEAGIQAEYPRNWLIDNEGDYIFRVRNTTQIGFRTTIQLAARPVGPETTVRSVLDSLTLGRSQSLASYNVLSIEPLVLPDETPATIMNYTFALSENVPFLESLPTIVQGVDVLTIKRGQAIVITFLSDVQTFKDNYVIFEQFLNRLEF